VEWCKKCRRFARGSVVFQAQLAGCFPRQDARGQFGTAVFLDEVTAVDAGGRLARRARDVLD
jgi:hypothetical protein